MLESVSRVSFGTSLTVGAVLVFAAWWLMPDAATNDAVHILAAVAPRHEAVLLSGVLQLVGCALLGVGLLSVSGPHGPPRLGVALLLVGTIGMAADAVYHQIAARMASPGAALDAMLPVFEDLQTRDIWSLMPLLASFLVGAPVLGWQLRRGSVAPRWAAHLLMAPLVGVPVGGLLVAAGALPRRALFLIVLGQICGGLAGIGASRIFGVRGSSPRDLLVRGEEAR